MRGGLGHSSLSQYLPMSVLCYALLLTASVFFVTALPPNLCCERPVRRNEIYYGCCLLMCCCMANGTLQLWRLQHFASEDAKDEKIHFTFDEAHLLTPFGLSSCFWMNFVNYFIYIAIIYMIDNHISYRNLALYWSGATLTSELVAIFACCTGSHSHVLQYAEYIHIVYIGACSWVILKFAVLLPRRIQIRYAVPRFGQYDFSISICLLILNVYALIRGLGAMDGNQAFIHYYVTQYEPYIAHPSKFGTIWTLYTAVYGIPFHSVVISALLKPGNRWLINMAILYAASVLQGTFVYLSYPFYPIADRPFITPHWLSFFFVLLINLFYVAVVHFLMYRCLKDQGYFHGECLKPGISEPLSPLGSQTKLYPLLPDPTISKHVESPLAQPPVAQPMLKSEDITQPRDSLEVPDNSSEVPANSSVVPDNSSEVPDSSSDLPAIAEVTKTDKDSVPKIKISEFTVQPHSTE